MTRRRYWIYFFLFTYSMICYADRTVLSVASTSVAEEFDLSPVALGYLFSSFLWIYALMMLPSGTATDRFGARRVVAASAAFWSIAQMLGGVATNFVTLLLTRLGLGIGEAPSAPVSYRSLRDWTPARERGLSLSILQAGRSLGPAVGGPLAAWIIIEFSWRMAFIVTGAIGLVWVAAWLLMVSTPEKTKWIPEPERRFILDERAAEASSAPAGGMGYLRLMRSPTLWSLQLTSGCGVYTIYLYMTWLPHYLQTERNLSLSSSAWLSSAPFFVAMAVIIASGWIGDRILTPETMRNGGRRVVVVTCMALCTLGAAIPFTESLTLAVILMMFPVAFSNAACTANTGLCNDLLRSEQDCGRVFAFVSLGGNLFGMMAPIVTGYIVEITGSFTGAFLVAAALNVLGVATTLIFSRGTVGEPRPAMA